MKKRYLFRSMILIILTAYLQVILVPAGIMAQVNSCGYDPVSPDLEHARQNFRALNYRCAEQEIQDLLRQETVDIEDKANAHVLLAAVYYAMLKNDQEKRQKVVGQFSAAFRAYQDWTGDLDIKSSEFAAMMEEARIKVEQEEAAAAALEADTTAAAVPPTAEAAGKPWYTKWWAIALGVGVVAGVVVAAGGGGDGGTPADTLAAFPDPPAKNGTDPGK